MAVREHPTGIVIGTSRAHWACCRSCESDGVGVKLSGTSKPEPFQTLRDWLVEQTTDSALRTRRFLDLQPHKFPSPTESGQRGVRVASRARARKTVLAPMNWPYGLRYGSASGLACNGAAVAPRLF